MRLEIRRIGFLLSNLLCKKLSIFYFGATLSSSGATLAVYGLKLVFSHPNADKKCLFSIGCYDRGEYFTKRMITFP